MTSRLVQTAGKSLALGGGGARLRWRGARSLDQLAANPPALTRELAWEHAQDGEIFVTWSNYHFTDFAISWAHNLKRVGVGNYLIGAMDLQAGEVRGGEIARWLAEWKEGRRRGGGGMSPALRLATPADSRAWAGHPDRPHTRPLPEFHTPTRTAHVKPRSTPRPAAGV